MAYEFFLSYTRANNDAFLKKFFDELSQSIRDSRGLGQTAEVGFFDQRDLELGEQWDAAIVDALQTSKVFLAITSPGYFKSEYCGKEWGLFRQRLTASVKQPLPPLIKPIVWIPSRIDTLSTAVTAGQLAFGDPQAVQNRRGFKFLLKNLQEHQATFNHLIDSLAQEICDAADAHELPALNPVPSLRSARSEFISSGVGRVPLAPTGPKHVRFVYVAADPHAFGAARVPDPYVDAGGADWKPFYPDDKTRIHRLVQNFVSTDDLDFTSEEIRFSDNLLAEVDDAWAKRQIVVLIVDGWTVHWGQQYRTILSQLDRRLDYHWCVMVPRNDADQDAAAVRAQIDNAISTTFDRHANFARNPLFYRDNIRTSSELKRQLSDVLTRLKEEIKKRAEVTKPMPAGPSRAVLAGPSAQV
jgi:FxsC-like protein